MKRNKMILLGMLLCTILVCVGIRFKLKPSYITEKLSQDTMKLRFGTYQGLVDLDGLMDFELGMYQNEYDELDELIENADVIVIGTLKNRKQEGKVLNTEIEVVQRIKGNSGNQIFVFEPAYIDTSDMDDALYMKCGYVPITSDEKYVFFLQKEELYENHEQYNLLSSYFGKFRIGEKVNISTLKAEDEHYLKDYQNSDYFYANLDEVFEMFQEDCVINNSCEEDMELNAMKKYMDLNYEEVWNNVQLWLKNEGWFN